MKKDNRFFIKTWSTGEGVTITTDSRWDIKKEDIYINPITNLCLVKYLNVNGEMQYSSTTYESFDYIKIDKEIE